MEEIKRLLVTGAHRSGTTWVGKMISASPELIYIHEPFALNKYYPDITSLETQYWFTYVTEKNEKLYSPALKNTLNLRYPLKKKIVGARNYRQFIRILNKYVYYTFAGLTNHGVLMKDPIAIYSAPWLQKKFDMGVLVLIRHPAAFVLSIKEKGWSHPFNHFLNQPQLIKDYLFPFEEEIYDFSRSERDIIDQACLLWRMIYYVIAKYQESYKDWLYVKHDDLSLDVANSFAQIFAHFDLEMTEEVHQTILIHSDNALPSNAHLNQKIDMNIYRKSSVNVDKWRRKLSKDEILHVRKSVEDVSSIYYSDKDW